MAEVQRGRKLRVRGLTVVGVYGDSDPFLAILEGIGGRRQTWQVERASEVEWEDGEWVARLARPLGEHPAGHAIARGHSRSRVIEAEVEWLEDHGLCG